jgi:hypothetical protein
VPNAAAVAKAVVAKAAAVKVPAVRVLAVRVTVAKAGIAKAGIIRAGIAKAAAVDLPCQISPQNGLLLSLHRYHRPTQNPHSRPILNVALANLNPSYNSAVRL